MSKELAKQDNSNALVQEPKVVKPFLNELTVRFQAVEPALRAFADSVLTEIAPLEAEIKALTVATVEDSEAMAAKGSKLAVIQNGVENIRKGMVKPLSDIVSAINTVCKAPGERADMAKKQAASAVTMWIRQQNDAVAAENRRQTNAAYRSQAKAVAEYVAACGKAKESGKPIPAPADGVQALLYQAPNLPADAEAKEVAQIQASHATAMAFSAQARMAAAKANAPAPVAKAKVEVHAAPVAPGPIKSVGTFQGREDITLTVVDAASTPPQFLKNLTAFWEKPTMKLTAGGDLPIFGLKKSDVLDEFRAGRQVPGWKVERVLGGSV
jgi:hypothetical protein